MYAWGADDKGMVAKAAVAGATKSLASLELTNMVGEICREMA